MNFRHLAVQLKKAQAEAADATTQLAAVEQALQTLEAGDMDAIKHQYIDAVRKMAVTQVRLFGDAFLHLSTDHCCDKF